MRLLPSCLVMSFLLAWPWAPPAVAAPESILGLKSPGALRVLGGRVVGPPGFAGRGVTIGDRLVLAPGRSAAIGYQSGRALLETNVLGFAGEARQRAGSRPTAVRLNGATASISQRVDLGSGLGSGLTVEPALSDEDRVAVAAGLRRIFDRQDRAKDRSD